MKSPRSLAFGWGGLLLTAGLSFYYVKKTILERRKQHIIDDRDSVRRPDDQGHISKNPAQDR
ncbi:hypothetical protein SERLA73DRAFT_130274 [Serpula lacrymans var. lacrymans S7.3]|uniref:Uncharacterized protein n=2 Tax=Serpula lacrymans var. lacrymans TaxID=341189 RepID=F8PJV6_SERL3|nr:uncharacterized protein SERLADRAFT_378804 [Serpula lacrymans var. lacrymans S7.9]EGO03778.1 hypothetical protein SERLA73DRAFT_130274 [Serpula lacrymans var. lacrymans S7.3]EGO29640.1 hypothetical protein SERLADRAFT_378804 [Serpula lacrymans var. lacrymans S7.9]